jgi:hypothetical protein
MPLPIQVTMVFMRAMLVVMLMLDCLLCVYGERLEDDSRYRTCIANPAGCTYLYAANPPTVQHVRACDALSVAEWLGGWGSQGRGQQVAHHGHHTDERGDVEEPGGDVRFLPPSTLRHVQRWWVLTWGLSVVLQGAGQQPPHGHHADGAGAVDAHDATVRATGDSPSPSLLHGFRHRVLRWGGATRCHSYVLNNAGLRGDLVSVGTFGTAYSGDSDNDGIGGTALGTACPSSSSSSNIGAVAGGAVALLLHGLDLIGVRR